MIPLTIAAKKVVKLGVTHLMIASPSDGSSDFNCGDKSRAIYTLNFFWMIPFNRSEFSTFHK